MERKPLQAQHCSQRIKVFTQGGSNETLQADRTLKGCTILASGHVRMRLGWSVKIDKAQEESHE